LAIVSIALGPYCDGVRQFEYRSERGLSRETERSDTNLDGRLQRGSRSCDPLARRSVPAGKADQREPLRITRANARHCSVNTSGHGGPDAARTNERGFSARLSCALFVGDDVAQALALIAATISTLAPLSMEVLTGLVVGLAFRTRLQSDADKHSQDK
jgi:hypothetical protein